MEAHLRTLAPADLTDLPVYILFGPEVPAHLAPQSGVLAWTSGIADLVLCDSLPAAGLSWQGRGPAMVISAAFDPIDGADPDEQVILNRAKMKALARHEMAHCLETLPLLRRQAHGQTRAPADTEAWAIRQFRDSAPAAKVAPFEAHGWRFIRLATHLDFRASRVPELVQYPCWTGSLYDLSPAEVYAEVLVDELNELAGASAEEILAAPPPLPFRELWQRDFRRWFDAAESTPTVAGHIAAHSYEYFFEG